MNSLALAGKQPACSKEPVSALRGREAFREAIAELRNHLARDSSTTLEDLMRLRAGMLELMAKAGVQVPVHDALFREELEPVARRDLIFPSDQIAVSVLAGEPYYVVDARIKFLRILERDVPNEFMMHTILLSLGSFNFGGLRHEMPERPRLWEYETFRRPMMIGSFGLVASLPTLLYTSLSPFLSVPTFVGSVLVSMAILIRSELESRRKSFQFESEMIRRLNASNAECERLSAESQARSLENLKRWAFGVSNSIKHCAQGVKEALAALGAPDKA